MSLGKRHIGRRVAGVGVAVALMVLGLQAPAFAATTVTSFTPTSGPAAGGCVVVVTGTGFSLSPDANTTVKFLGTGGADATVVDAITDTELWATAPPLTAGENYTIRVDNLQGTGTASTQTFTAINGNGACAPTITSFTPTCGVAGTIVKITGTNLLAANQGGGLVEFSPFAVGNDGVNASPTNPDISDSVTLQVTVPTGAADGAISVTTGVTESFSTTAFAAPPPDCAPVTGNEHANVHGR
jgi:hypothetical protein